MLMAQRAIREYDAKKLLQRHLGPCSGGKIGYQSRSVLVTPEVGLRERVADNPWLRTAKLAVKPDQLFGKRGKNRLVLADVDFEQAAAWIDEHTGREVTVHREFSAEGDPADEGVQGTLTHFIVEPMVTHGPEEEYYLAVTGHRHGDTVLFSTAGGVDIEAAKDGMISIDVPIGADLDAFDFETPLERVPGAIPLEPLAELVRACVKCYSELHLGFLEFNPLVITDRDIIPVDVKVRLDDTAAFMCEEAWGAIDLPVPFGRSRTDEEAYIERLDERSGASLKLTILNPQGRVWTMVAGGGASVIYADTVVDLGYGDELANYGEYSGDPSTAETREYAKTILDLMTRDRAEGGKVLIIGGGIANFTDVATTFEGIIEALEDYAPRLRENGIRIYVRRGGPNYIEGLRKIREAAERLGLDMQVHGPELHMTAVVKEALDSLPREVV
jgi:ATP-citrate lyase beta-subunit